MDKNLLREVEDERYRQDAKWGEQDHAPADWLAIITEELGEAAEAYLEFRAGARHSLTQYRSELFQVAASALAAVECLERRNG